MREVMKHLASSDVSIGEDGSVMAGLRSVGRIEPVGDLARMQFSLWCAGA